LKSNFGGHFLTSSLLSLLSTKPAFQTFLKKFEALPKDFLEKAKFVSDEFHSLTIVLGSRPRNQAQLVQGS